MGDVGVGCFFFFLLGDALFWGLLTGFPQYFVQFIKACLVGLSKAFLGLHSFSVFIRFRPYYCWPLGLYMFMFGLQASKSRWFCLRGFNVRYTVYRLYLTQ